jgi:flagella basal body P-ring formation protein FlgA
MNRLLTIALILSLASTAHASEWVSTKQYAGVKAEAASMMPLPNKSFFTITMRDVEKKVAEAMVEDSVAEEVEVLVLPSGMPMLHKADHPIELVIHSLQVNPDSKRWQAEAYVVANGKTETVKPIAGRYDEMVKVPVLSRQMGNKDVIELEDIEFKLMPSRKLRKDTVTDSDQLLGKSARKLISAERMIRLSEVAPAITVEKDREVEMTYNTPYMSLRTSGKALENGHKGDLIRVMNHDTQRTVSARVVDAHRVEVTPTTIIN